MLVSSAVAADRGATAANTASEQPFFAEERPLWRRALALPAAAIELTAWPIKQTLFWMERTDVPERVEDVVMYPIRLVRGGEDEAK